MSDRRTDDGRRDRQTHGKIMLNSAQWLGGDSVTDRWMDNKLMETYCCSHTPLP